MWSIARTDKLALWPKVRICRARFSLWASQWAESSRAYDGAFRRPLPTTVNTLLLLWLYRVHWVFVLVEYILLQAPSLWKRFEVKTSRAHKGGNSCRRTVYCVTHRFYWLRLITFYVIRVRYGSLLRRCQSGYINDPSRPTYNAYPFQMMMLSKLVLRADVGDKLPIKRKPTHQWRA